jgi:hypothetical protein
LWWSWPGQVAIWASAIGKLSGAAGEWVKRNSRWSVT